MNPIQYRQINIQEVINVCKKFNGDLDKAAKHLNVSKNTLKKVLINHGLWRNK